MPCALVQSPTYSLLYYPGQEDCCASMVCSSTEIMTAVKELPQTLEATEYTHKQQLQNSPRFLTSYFKKFLTS